MLVNLFLFFCSLRSRDLVDLVDFPLRGGQPQAVLYSPCYLCAILLIYQIYGISARRARNLLNLFQETGFAVDDEAAHFDILGHEGVGADSLDGAAHRFGGVLEAFEPVVEVDAALADGVERLFRHATGEHLVVEVVVAHVAGAAVRVRHHHHVLHAQLIDGHDKAAHGRVEGRDDQPSGVLDDFGIAVLQPQRRRKQFREASVHARQHRQLLVGVLVRAVLLVAFVRHELPVVLYDLIYHSEPVFRLQRYKFLVIQ